MIANNPRVFLFGKPDNRVNSKIKCHQSHLNYHFMTDLSETRHTVSVVISPRASCFLSITGSHFASLTLTLVPTLCISSTPVEQFRYLVACPRNKSVVDVLADSVLTGWPIKIRGTLTLCMLFNSSQGTCIRGHRTVCVHVICIRRH